MSNKIQGEGDYESTRKYNADTKKFMDTNDVNEAARRAAPGSREEAADLKQAEDIGRSHAQGGRDAESWPKDKADTRSANKPAGAKVGQPDERSRTSQQNAGSTEGGGTRN
ncbi:MAG TPA: hypothetical protein VMF03_01500 [Steroidobacteraceae bacterium]|nr:hypothetical protein [Steroidobacteraceae bacterium]